jgi:hypothetical protein
MTWKANELKGWQTSKEVASLLNVAVMTDYPGISWAREYLNMMKAVSNRPK